MIIDKIKAYFDDRGIVRGTQEIVETTVAVASLAAVGYVVAKQVYGHFVARNAPSCPMDAPIDATRLAGSAADMMRATKQTKKAIDREMKAVEKIAIDRLSYDRNDLFNSLPYADRRAILEADGVDVESMERQVQTEIRVNDEIKKTQEARKKTAGSFFNRMRNAIPLYRDTESTFSIPQSEVPKTGEMLTYDYINRVARENALKKLGPDALAHPDRFIIKPDGTIIPDTYEFKKARAEETKKLLGDDHRLPPIPNPLNQLDSYGPGVKKAYLDMRGQLARISSLRRSTFDKMAHTGTQEEKMQRLEEAWKDAANRMKNPQPVWHGDKKESNVYRTTASPDGGSQFMKDLDEIISIMDKLGIDVNSLTATDEEMDNLMKVINGFTIDEEMDAVKDAAWAERLEGMLQNANGGIPPKDVPFFDEDFYDTDIDSLSSEAHRPLMKIRHEPLTVEKAVAAAAAPTKWKPGARFTQDYNKTQYRPLQKHFRDTGTNWRKRMRAESQQNQLKNTWRMLHPFGATQDIMAPVGFLEGMENKMAQQPALFDKSHLSILMDKDLERMTSSKPKKGKKKKKKDEDSFFSEFALDIPKKGKKGKKKKKDKKGKKGKKFKKEKPEAFLDTAYSDDGPTGDLCTAILKGVSKQTARSFGKSLKLAKAGKLYTKF